MSGDWQHGSINRTSRSGRAVDYLNAPVVIYERPPIIEKLAFVRSLLPDSRPTAVIWLVYKTKRRVRGHLHRPRRPAGIVVPRILRPQPSVALKDCRKRRLAKEWMKPRERWVRTRLYCVVHCRPRLIVSENTAERSWRMCRRTPNQGNSNEKESKEGSYWEAEQRDDENTRGDHRNGYNNSDSAMK